MAPQSCSRPPGHWINADAMGFELKRSGDPLDTSSGMRMQEIKLRVQRADYVVDPVLVAEAMLRHAVSHRRCWKPRATWATPSNCSWTAGGPSATTPIQVSDAADSAAWRSPGATHTSNS